MKVPLYFAERNVGIAINPATGATVDKKLYQAEYLRLNHGVSLAFAAECYNNLDGKSASPAVDVLAAFGNQRDLIIGGQQGVARLELVEENLRLPDPPEIKTQYLRWTLLTPAIFAHGWLPGWVGEDGQVMLRNITRRQDESRPAWKERQEQAPLVGGSLIAARVGKPFAFSGWDTESGPKPTRLAVPAGSCYVFDCGDPAKAQTLAKLLNYTPRSDHEGPKGYGIGLCSSLNVSSPDFRLTLFCSCSCVLICGGSR